jgi:DNA-binding MarR family transcriptional regulator
VNDLPARRQVGAAYGNLVLDLFVLNQRIGALLDAALGPTGVRPSEYAVYSQLGLGAMTPSLLCERLGVSRSTMTGILATLQRRGDTERLPDPADRRSYRVALTDSGRGRLEECRPRFRTALERLARNLEADQDEVRRLLARVDQAAEKATHDLAVDEGGVPAAT